MREILFRGERADNSEWVEGYLYITQNGEYEIMTVDYNKIPTGFNFVQITGEPVCSLTIDTNMTTNTYTAKIHLNKAVSEFPVATRYQFSFIIGALNKEL